MIHLELICLENHRWNFSQECSSNEDHSAEPSLDSSDAYDLAWQYALTK